ncbi:MAG: chemotaxis protein CheW [Deltaproteobacteria bacterium]|nr:chemotaxis protein CheW [Candidatus Zymogenaceae bacterium]
MAEEKRAEGLERAGDMQIVTFFLSNEEFGVDILLVQEIIRPTTITEVPNTPAFLEGVINLRGKVVPVVDLRRRLDLEITPTDKATRIMIIELEEKVTGFIVDSVSKVMSVHTESIQSAPEMVTAGVESEYIYGVSRLEDRLIILLDFSKILTDREREQLTGVE